MQSLNEAIDYALKPHEKLDDWHTCDTQNQVLEVAEMFEDSISTGSNQDLSGALTLIAHNMELINIHLKMLTYLVAKYLDSK